MNLVTSLPNIIPPQPLLKSKSHVQFHRGDPLGDQTESSQSYIKQVGCGAGHQNYLAGALTGEIPINNTLSLNCSLLVRSLRKASS